MRLKRGAGRPWPRVSVVIPMRNEAATIEKCLRAVLAQDYPRQMMEVIVVDGRSTDHSRRLVETMGGKDPRVQALDNPAKVVPAALNLAIRAATGEIIVRVDGHTEISADYVRRSVECLDHTGAEVAGGPMRCAGGGVVGDAIAAATSSRFGIGNSYFHYGDREREVDSVYMGVFQRSVFEAVGWFDEELVCNQDDEFNYRVRRAGGRVVMSPQIRSFYQNRRTLLALARQYWRYGYYKARVLQKHPQTMSWRHAVPPLFVLVLAASLALLPAGGWAGACFPLALGSYAAGALVVASASARRYGLRVAGLLPLAFATIHLAWGSGILAGLWSFRRRWRDREWSVNLQGAFASEHTRGTGE